jgi:hypothetical protein
MRRRVPMLRILLAVAVLVGALGLAGLGGVGGASTQDACDGFNNFDTSQGGDAGSVQQTDARQTAQRFRASATNLSGTTKNALATIAEFYEKLGKSGNTTARLKVVALYTKSYAKAWAKFTKWYLANCIVIPTIPSISIPTIPSISIPTVPTTAR